MRTMIVDTATREPLWSADTVLADTAVGIVDYFSGSRISFDGRDDSILIAEHDHVVGTGGTHGIASIGAVASAPDGDRRRETICRH